jgi:hypothetical protein
MGNGISVAFLARANVDCIRLESYVSAVLRRQLDKPIGCQLPSTVGM